MCKIRKNLNKPVLVLYGIEPYLINYYKKRLVSGISMPDINVLNTEVFEERTVDFLTSMPLLDDHRVVFYQVDSLKMASDNAQFNLYLENPIRDAVLVVLPSKVDKRAKVYKTLEKKDSVIFCDKASQDQINSVLFTIVRNSGCQVKEEAYDRFLELENYESRDDISLYDLKNDWESLNALAQESNNSTIDIDLVESFVKKRVKSDVFGVVQMIIDRDVVAVNDQASIIDEPIGPLSALLREYRIAYKMKLGFTANEIGVKYSSLRSFPREKLYKGINILVSTIRGIKDGSIPEKASFQYACNALMA